MKPDHATLPAIEDEGVHPGTTTVQPADLAVDAPSRGYPTHDGTRCGWYAACHQNIPDRRVTKRTMIATVRRRYKGVAFEWRAAGEHIEGVFERWGPVTSKPAAQVDGESSRESQPLQSPPMTAEMAGG